jgi:hypothetical protein
VRVVAIHPPTAAGGHLVLEVMIANRSDAILPGGDGEGTWISLSTRWRRLDGSREARERPVDGQRFGIGEPLPPGRAVSRTVALEIGVDPGRWRVTVDLVEESVAWFGDGDEFEVEIEPRLLLQGVKSSQGVPTSHHREPASLSAPTAHDRITAP